MYEFFEQVNPHPFVSTGKSSGMLSVFSLLLCAKKYTEKGNNSNFLFNLENKRK
ncbi:hypothetical protein J2128_001213 [Methanomicrobium sp. W14]|nr:hypothetical protein [Methanomicrobium sp. W14]